MTLAATAQLSTSQLLAALEGVTAIPVVPYRDGSIDHEAHLKERALSDAEQPPEREPSARPFDCRHQPHPSDDPAPSTFAWSTSQRAKWEVRAFT